ncbi:general stress protein [Peribacillus glennii]|uniref:Low temperature-induced protein n=1 Tax=Peribacillus glennii TaxID=2303991 RepID=A0A372LBP5_9BACI|nr:general stress protein [Peribacillus glennii]RFU62902.1 low temperature-induced protein [Peribacillus glennii]
MDKRVIGVYDNGDDAVRAVEELKAQGYDRDDISVIARDRDDVDAVNEETGTKTEEGLAAGAATGGILGGAAGLLAGVGALAIPGIGPILAAGPIAATLTGAAVGAGTGGLAGALVGMGIPEDEADRYERDVKDGKLLVLLDPDARKNDLLVNNDLNSTRDSFVDSRNQYDRTVDMDRNDTLRRY